MQYLQAIREALEKNSSAEALAAHKKFVPGTMKIYGVRTPVLNDLAKQYSEGGFALVQALWEAGAFEEKLTALKMLGRIAKKDPAAALQLIEQFSSQIDNWAVCDAMGMQALKPILLSHQKQIFSLAKKYNGSANLWERRLSLVLVEYYTRFPEHLPAINKLVKALEKDEAYYVRKAITWIKRNMAKQK